MRGVQHVGIEPDGAILFSSHDDAFLCRYDPRGRTFSTLAGKPGKEEFGGDGGLAAQATIRVNGFTCDREGNILIAGANRIRRISRSTGLIQTIEGETTGDFVYLELPAGHRQRDVRSVAKTIGNGATKKLRTQGQLRDKALSRRLLALWQR
jgi:hypothetical protein